MMSIILLEVGSASAQCNTSNATSCVCSDGSQECDLLPDMTISWYGITNYLLGPNYQNNRVYITGSTPNIGHGPFVARGVDADGYRWFVCGTDTFSIYDPSGSQTFSCPSGGTAKQLTFQRIYHKSGNSMSSYNRLMPQGMTYHPTHGHTHFDQWGLFTLRLPEAGVTDPRQWPIVNSGFKLGFCLMDYNSCNDAAVLHHCKDDNTVYNQGDDLFGPDFPNYGLGGGNYGCSMVEQGISSGYTDIYSEYLDGMWIDIPVGTCNGEYWVVYEVDPFDVVLEENEDNNYTAVPVTLSQQPSGTALARILADGTSYICQGDSVRLRANAGLAYQWNTGETSSSIWAGPGTYSVTVTSYCGIATSAPFTVTALPQPAPPTVETDTVCEGHQATLNATGSSVVWRDVTGEVLATGSQFITPPLFSNTTYYVTDENTEPGTTGYGGKPDNSGNGDYHTGGQSMKFDVSEASWLRSVKLYSSAEAYRTVELYNSVGALVTYRTALVPQGESRMDLNIYLAPGTGFLLTVGGQCDLYRNSSGVSYPYQIGNAVTITGSTGGAQYYYYFYDWEIEVGGGSCQSEPALAHVVVENCDGISGPSPIKGFEVFPNPADGLFNLSVHLSRPEPLNLRVMDVMGRNLINETWALSTGHFKRAIDLSASPSGVYLLQIEAADHRITKRLMVR
jgi:hypothetical protein